jgi:hypothetical protein
VEVVMGLGEFLFGVELFAHVATFGLSSWLLEVVGAGTWIFVIGVKDVEFFCESATSFF